MLVGFLWVLAVTIEHSVGVLTSCNGGNCNQAQLTDDLSNPHPLRVCNNTILNIHFPQNDMYDSEFDWEDHYLSARWWPSSSESLIQCWSPPPTRLLLLKPIMVIDFSVPKTPFKKKLETQCSSRRHHFSHPHQPNVHHANHPPKLPCTQPLSQREQEETGDAVAQTWAEKFVILPSLTMLCRRINNLHFWVWPHCAEESTTSIFDWEGVS